jgi:acyl-coenzyme A synthetase/AMP-(fatty) acid ligase/3-hydroxymyristoyl/3-hydroxydecanoyl-(acyl carrier protein) dehydratase
MSDSFHDPYALRLAGDPGEIVGWRGGQAFSLAQFSARIAAWRGLLRRTAGRNMALYLEDSIEFAAALLGAWQEGKTVWLSADTLPASCACLAASVDAFLGEFPPHLSPLTPAAGDGCSAPLQPLQPLAADLAALVVHTSGTTGVPKAMPKRLAQLTCEVAALEALFGARLGRAEVLATVSHQHIYGLLFRVLWPLAAGRPMHALACSFPEQLATQLGLRDCVLVASPAHLKRLPAHLAWGPARTHLRAVFSSGGPLDSAAALAAGQLLGQQPIEVYGSSETGGIAWRQRQAGGDDGWTAFAAVAWRLGTADDLLEVRSAYLDGDHWLQLADRAQATADGRFLLLGRSDRIVKIEEKRISLDALEAALTACELVQEARVMVDGASAVRHRLAAFVVLAPAGQALLAGGGKAALNRRLRAALGEVVEAVALPRRWRYLAQLPLNAQGKISQAQLQALLDDAPPKPRLPRIRILEQSGQRLLLEVVVPASLFYLDGHFPGTPLLAGVVQIDWAIHYGRAHFGLAPTFCAISALKFQQVILAEQPVHLELVHDVAKSSLNFRYFSSAGQHGSGRILFETRQATADKC